jgi:tRNA (cmo5U34)-methyltransferase
MQDGAAAKFDAGRAAEYERQSRIRLAGYEACHELVACLLSAVLGSAPRRLLIAGAGGTAQEIQVMAPLEPAWRFTAVDPSQPMLDQAMGRLESLGIASRVDRVLGYVRDLPPDTKFDGATLIGVLHHLPGRAAKELMLQEIAQRLPPGAPFVLAGNAHAYASRPLLLQAWAQRWRMAGASPDEVHAKLGKMLQGADPPQDEDTALGLLRDAGFGRPERFFCSLFWTGWITFRE